jgi:outer membrane lipoprotein-sorting protein
VKGLHIWLVIAFVLGAAALGMACKSSSKKSGTATPKTTVAKTVAATAAKTGTPASKTLAPSSTASSDAGAQFRALANNVNTKEGKVTYTYTTTAGGTQTQGTFTLYSKPPDGSRFDLDIGGASYSVISSGGNSYVCTNAGGQGTCINSPGGASAIPFLGYFNDPATLSSFVGTTGVTHSTKTIAGQHADCYSTTTSDGSSEVCFTSDGLMLSVHGGSAALGQFDLEATSVSNTVASSDLTPPYPVQ